MWRSLTFAAAVAAAMATGVPAAAEKARSVSTPTRNVSQTPRLAEGEATVAYDPTDRRNIIVGSNQWQPLTYSDSQDYVGLGPSGFTRCAAYSSRNGGRNWRGGAMLDGGVGSVPNPIQVPHVPGEFEDPGNVFSADQNTVFDRTGTAYYTCINFGVTTGLEELDVWRSADGGRHWSDPVAAFSQVADTDRQMDRPFLAIDRSTGRHGTLYLAWETIFYDPVLPEVFVRSSRDGGRTWGPIVRVDNSKYPAMWDARLFPMVGADGTLYVIYDSAGFETPFAWHPQVDHPSLVLASSTDGGRTFSHHWVARDIHRPAPPDEDEPELTEFISSMATDPRRAGRVAVAWPQRVHGDSRIHMRSSLDGGETWSHAIDVADDEPLTGNQHDHVMLRYLRDGRIVVVWRDRRYTGGGWYDPYDIFARVVRVRGNGSLDPGRTVRVTGRHQRPSTGHRGHMPSEYLGIEVAGRRGLGVAWESMRGRYPDDVYKRVPLRAFDR